MKPFSVKMCFERWVGLFAAGEIVLEIPQSIELFLCVCNAL